MNKGIAKAELIFIICLAGGFLIPPIIGGQWFLLGTFLAFFFCFGILEWIASSVGKKRTISQRMWDLKKTCAWKFWLIIGGMAIAWIALLYHFIV